jgi:hypothetical protein
MEHSPYLLAAENDWQLLWTCNRRQVQMLVGQSFCFEQEAEPIYGVFEISLGGCFAALLQQVEIIFYLFGIEFCWQALEVERHGSNVAAVVIEGAGTSAQDGDVALKSIQ